MRKAGGEEDGKHVSYPSSRTQHSTQGPPPLVHLLLVHACKSDVLLLPLVITSPISPHTRPQDLVSTY